MNQYKNAKVIMLPTEDIIAGNMLCIIKNSNKLKLLNPDTYFDIPQHLYITSSNEIKELPK